jgi:hypothetical protein
MRAQMTAQFPLSALIIGVMVAVMSAVGGHKKAQAELHWQPPKKEAMRVRLIALSLGFPRSSFFATHEVFIAEKQVSPDEYSLVKLVYAFLPYQPRLSEYGLDYSTLHELRAVRNPNCDESLRQMSTPEKVPNWPQPDQSWKYASNAPPLNSGRHRSHLPCYETTAEDYSKSIHEPLNHEQF